MNGEASEWTLVPLTLCAPDLRRVAVRAGVLGRRAIFEFSLPLGRGEGRL